MHQVSSAMTQSTALEKVPEAGALARQEDGLGLSVEHLVKRVEKVREVRDRVMHDGTHFGRIPGVKKPSLLKPGSEILCLAFQLAPKFHPVDRWDGEHLEVVVTCTLVHVPTGTELGDGIGSCSTRESKYAYRTGERSCPECGSGALNKSKKEPGFYCWAKKGGCGKTFGPNDKRITEQQVGRQPNPDIADQYNTVRKMACKRAHIAATLFVTGASELFTQDVEDMPRREAPPPEDDDEPRAQHGGGGSGNGSSSNGRSARQPAPANDSSDVPSDEELEQALTEIAAIDSVPGLQAHARANRGKRWNKVQIAALKAASEKRHAELTDPEFRDEAPTGDPEPPEHVN